MICFMSLIDSILVLNFHSESCLNSSPGWILCEFRFFVDMVWLLYQFKLLTMELCLYFELNYSIFTLVRNRLNFNKYRALIK